MIEQEYLEIERAAEFKSEFYRGEMFRMQGATREHVVISGNILAGLHLFFEGSPCEVYQNDMRLKVKPSGLYTYPDIMATCEHPEFADNESDNFLNPQVIFEVLSGQEYLLLVSIVRSKMISFTGRFCQNGDWLSQLVFQKRP